MWTIYCHVNKINGKRYIGLSKNPRKRWGYAGNNYRNAHHRIFAAAIEKYGWDNFEHVILDENIESLELANERERYWIAYFHTWIGDPECRGYNATIGGDGSKGRIATEEEKEYRRKLRLGMKMPEEWKKHMSETRKGKKQNMTPKKREALHKACLAMVVARKKKVICVETGIIYSSITEAAKLNNINLNTLSACVNKRQKTAGGYHWMTLENKIEENK